MSDFEGEQDSGVRVDRAAEGKKLEESGCPLVQPVASVMKPCQITRTLWQPEPPPLELLLSEPILNRSPEVNTDPTHRAVRQNASDPRRQWEM